MDTASTKEAKAEKDPAARETKPVKRWLMKIRSIEMGNETDERWLKRQLLAFHAD